MAAAQLTALTRVLGKQVVAVNLIQRALRLRHVLVDVNFKRSQRSDGKKRAVALTTRRLLCLSLQPAFIIDAQSLCLFSQMHAPLAATASAPKSKCIRVAVRVRPPMQPSVAAASASTTGTAATAPAPVPPPVAVTAENDADGPCIRLRERISDSFGHTHASEAVFRFDACYAPDTRQETVYNSEVKPWLDDCFTGVNTTVFCYGQTVRAPFNAQID